MEHDWGTVATMPKIQQIFATWSLINNTSFCNILITLMMLSTSPFKLKKYSLWGFFSSIKLRETLVGYERSVFSITKCCEHSSLWCYCQDYFTFCKMSFFMRYVFIFKSAKGTDQKSSTRIAFYLSKVNSVF